MWILGLEAGAALLLLVFIVWWTMFSGRPPEQPARQRQPSTPAQPGDKDAPGS
jgi:hypothetical protein